MALHVIENTFRCGFDSFCAKVAMLGISRTPPFRDFQRVAGISTFHVNTIVIGLELIANGGQKSPSLRVNWSPPKHPRQAVEQTKHFALLALMTHVVDAFDNLLRDYSDLSWLNLNDATRNILRKSVTKPGNVQWSIPERAQHLLDCLREPCETLLGLLEMMVNWRNSLVHSRRAKFRLSDSSSTELRAKQKEISVQYAGLDVCQTLDRFSAGKWPTLKEATTLIAVTQNLARTIDRAVIRSFGSKSEDVERIALKEIATAFGSLDGRWKRIWGRDKEARERSIANVLSNAGITDSTELVSAPLPASFIADLAAEDRSEIEILLQATHGAWRFNP